MIRRLQDHDTTALMEVWLQASRQAHGFLSRHFLAVEQVNIHHVWLPKSQTWVYLDHDELVGFISLIGNEVGALFVRPDRQSRGIGRALMNQAFVHREYLELDVFEANGIGRAFYARYGFAPVGRYVHEESGQPMIRLACSRPSDPDTRTTHCGDPSTQR